MFRLAPDPEYGARHDKTCMQQVQNSRNARATRCSRRLPLTRYCSTTPSTAPSALRCSRYYFVYKDTADATGGVPVTAVETLVWALDPMHKYTGADGRDTPADPRKVQ